MKETTACKTILYFELSSPLESQEELLGSIYRSRDQSSASTQLAAETLDLSLDRSPTIERILEILSQKRTRKLLCSRLAHKLLHLNNFLVIAFNKEPVLSLR